MAGFVVSYCPQLLRCYSLHDAVFFAFADLTRTRRGRFLALAWRWALVIPFSAILLPYLSALPAATSQ
jgi:hypothetical protein